MGMIVERKNGKKIMVKHIDKWIFKYVKMAVVEIILHAMRDGLDIEKIDKKQLNFLVAMKTKNLLDDKFNISNSNIESFMKLMNGRSNT